MAGYDLYLVSVDGQPAELVALPGTGNRNLAGPCA